MRTPIPERAVLVFRDDVRGCRRDGDFFFHVLNPGFRIHKDDQRIVRITPIPEA